MGENNYDKSDAAKDTSSTIKEVSEAWHQAREDAQGSGELPEREANKSKGSSSDDTGSNSSGK